MGLIGILLESMFDVDILIWIMGLVIGEIELGVILMVEDIEFVEIEGLVVWVDGLSFDDDVRNEFVMFCWDIFIVIVFFEIGMFVEKEELVIDFRVMDEVDCFRYCDVWFVLDIILFVELYKDEVWLG